MKIEVKSKNILEHLSEFHNISDEEIERRATNTNGGLDAQEALLLHCERDFCRSVNFSIIEGLNRIS